MDPITRAAGTFLAEAAAFWRAPKGSHEGAAEARVLPIIADVSARGDVVKTLRLGELALDNRWPLFVYEAPFAEARAWGDGLAAAIALDYQAVREGAEKEGVALPPFPAAGEGPSEKDPPLARAVWAMERAAALFADRLDGVLVALLPEAVADPRAFRHAVATLAATRFSPRVRLAVHDPPGGPLAGVLGPDGAHFHVDQDALAEHLKQLNAGGGSEGPPVAAPPEPTEEQRRAYEARTGRKLPSPAAARTLRALLVDGAVATGKREHELAATHYRAARALCQGEGMALEEAMVLIALGGASLAAGEVDLATDAYRSAGERAEALEAWPVACQAWLGAGGAQLTAKRYEAAALAYQGAAGAAERGKITVLGVEALRMAGTCHLLHGSAPEAMRAWLQAVELGSEIPAAERAATTFPQVAEDLAAMLERRGLDAQAAHVRSLVVAEAPPTTSASVDTLDLPPRAARAGGPALPFVSTAPPSSASPDTLDPPIAMGRAPLPFAPGSPAGISSAGEPVVISPAIEPSPPGPPDGEPTTLPATPSPLAPPLPFTEPEPPSETGSGTLGETPSPLRKVLPFSSDEGDAGDAPRGR